MKKFFKILTVFALILGVSACSSDKDNNNNTPNDSETFKVGFVYGGSASDGGYDQAHDEARKIVEKDLGVETLYKENVNSADFEKTAKDMIDQGAKVIFATTFDYMDPTVSLSEQYPDIAFYHCSGYMTTDNMSSYFGKIYQARYLSGIVAGSMTKTNKIGYVAAFAIPEVIRGINAFTLGVQSVNPDATVEVQWSGTWFDPVLEKEAANALINKGVDVLAQHQNTTAVQQAAEDAGIYGIGYNLDMSAAAPNAHLTSSIWHWDVFYKMAVQDVMDGKISGEAYWLDIDTGIVGLAKLNSVVPVEVDVLVKSVEIDLKNGNLNVFSGPINDHTGKERVAEGQSLSDSDLLSIDWFVEGVIGTLD